MGLLFWTLILWSLIMPRIQYDIIRNKRLEVIRRLQTRRKSRVLLLVHRQEQFLFFGIPIMRFINIEDSEEILREIRNTPKDMPIDLIIHTPGGLLLAATQIAKALKSHPAKTTVIIPHYAMSGGTLIALAADEIIMDPNAVLGPVDPQIQIPDMGVVPAPSIVRTVEEHPDKVGDKLLLFADVAKKAIKQVEDFVFELLRDKYGDDKSKELARVLSSGVWTHDYPITYEKLKELGLKVSTNVPAEVYELMNLYPQPSNPLRPGSGLFMPSLTKKEV
ncbi:MAG: ATP-dependent Clp protease proteolytic subunit [candidate division WOR-3 bacterium]